MEKKNHPLADYLKKRHITKVGFASDLGISVISLNNILNGSKKPSLALAVLIRNLTAGKIDCDIWVDLEEFEEMRQRKRYRAIESRKNKMLLKNVEKKPAS